MDKIDEKKYEKTAPTGGASNEVASEDKHASAWKIKEHDVIDDLRMIMSDYHIASFKTMHDGIMVSFINGQEFLVSVRETA